MQVLSDAWTRVDLDERILGVWLSLARYRLDGIRVFFV